MPNILLIGDSISGGYEKQVKQALTGKANVIKNLDNVHFTGSGNGHLAKKVVATLEEAIKSPK